VGKFAGRKVLLKAGQSFILDTECVLGDSGRVGLDYPELVQDMRPGDVLLLDDGRITLDVEYVEDDEVHTRVRHGGELSNNKGINRQGGGLSAPALTPKDMEDIQVAAELGVHVVAVSFPKTGADMRLARELIKAAGMNALLIAKIERAEAIGALDEIIDASDGIMVARGDLAVEVGNATVPGLQKRMLKLARERHKFTITATQMMESMIQNPVPTRAEVSDVANAVLDGTDAVMLSGETAAGKFPAEAVETMDAILRETESYQFFARKGLFRDPVPHRDSGIQDAISAAISQLSRDLMVRCVVVETRTGRTALVVASDRPSSPIIALTPSEQVRRRLQLIWGVVPHLVSGSRFRVEKSIAHVESFMKGLKLANSGDTMLMVRGIGYKKTDIQSITIHQM
jgi:pyruvate kinase